MMRFIKQGLALAGSLAILGSNVGMVGAADSALISGTGFASKNLIKINKSQGSSTSQNNFSSVKNYVSVGVNTGGNKANQNTGDGSVTSGAASVGVVIGNSGNTNTAPASNCGCEPDDTEATIEDTGALSFNKVKVSSSSWNSQTQKNKSWIVNSAAIDAQTGNNKANQNTGNGTVTSSDAEVVVQVANEGGTNVLE